MVRVVDDFLVAELQAVIVVDPGGAGIGIADVFDIAILPDPVRNTDDVINDIPVGILESAHGLHGSEVIRDALFLVGSAVCVLVQRNCVAGRHVRAAERFCDPF